jgi:glycosyltransferase 2 family protein
MGSINKPLLWLRVAGAIVAVSAIGFLLHRLHPGALVEALRATRPGWVAVAVLVYGLLFLPAAWRWHLALRLSKNDVNFCLTTRISLIGHFFYTIFFGAAGGDVAKSMLYSRWEQKPLPEILVAASLDRLLGLGGLIVFAAIAFALGAAYDGFAGLHSLTLHASSWWWLLLPLTVLIVVLVRANPPGNRSSLDRFRRVFRETGRQVIAGRSR